MSQSRSSLSKKVVDLFSLAADLPAGACGATTQSRQEAAQKVGYRPEDFANAPDEALLGVGCGNPVALASLMPGQVVLDLGSGAGFDAFLASKAVGPSGRVIGVDLNPKMLARARRLVADEGYENIDFREGAIEELPVESATVDVVISNCVINLSSAKHRVYDEAMRVLKPGGRVMISDLVASKPMPGWFLDVVNKVLGFPHWLIERNAYLDLVRDAGFVDVKVVHEISGGFLISCRDPACDSIFSGVPTERRSEIPALAEAVTSIKMAARKSG